MTTQKSKALKLSKSANSTLLKVQTMIDQDAYCPEIIQQIDSVIGLLKSSKKELLAGHLDHCIEHKIKENKQKAIDELMKILKLSQ